MSYSSQSGVFDDCLRVLYRRQPVHQIKVFNDVDTYILALAVSDSSHELAAILKKQTIGFPIHRDQAYSILWHIVSCDLL